MITYGVVAVVLLILQSSYNPVINRLLVSIICYCFLIGYYPLDILPLSALVLLFCLDSLKVKELRLPLLSLIPFKLIELLVVTNPSLINTIPYAHLILYSDSFFIGGVLFSILIYEDAVGKEINTFTERLKIGLRNTLSLLIILWS